jgi:hypothetical protein
VLPRSWHRASFAAGSLIAFGLLTSNLVNHIEEHHKYTLATKRTFHGIIHVYEYHYRDSYVVRSLFSGRIKHGSQVLGRGAAVERYPTSYYGSNSGQGLSVRLHPKRTEAKPLNMATIGLGVGTAATHMRPGDRMRFYEINPAVETLSREYFSYLDLSQDIEVVLGDARRSLARELAENGSQQFDILVLDAFSGDAIPIHLMTEEAIELYLAHLAPDGVLALHVTNLHFDLTGLAHNLALHQGYPAWLVTQKDPGEWESDNDWVIITRNTKLSSDRRFLNKAQPLQPVSTVYWTDDFNNLYEVLL